MARISSRGAMTEPTSRPPKSSTPVSSSWAKSSIRPSARDALSITVSSSAVGVDDSSSRACTPKARTPRLLRALSTRITGRKTNR